MFGFDAQELRRFEFSQLHMGTPFQIVCYAADEAQARTASDAAYIRIREIDRTFSDYDPESQVSRLSRTVGKGEPVRVSEELWWLLDRAIVFSRVSDGSFDVTVGPLTLLWRQAKRLPSPEVIRAARSGVGYEKIRRDEQARTVELTVPGMRLDSARSRKVTQPTRRSRFYVVTVSMRPSCPAVATRRSVTRRRDVPVGASCWGARINPNAPCERVAFVANVAAAT